MNKNAIDYDKISDDVYWLSMDTVLRMNVTLSNKNQDGTRRFFHTEYEYSSKYVDKKRVKSIKRSFKYYLSLEYLKDKECFTQIQPSDMYALQDILAKVVRWGIDKRTFGIVDGTLRIKAKQRPEILQLFGKTITFEPIVIRFSESISPGIRITFYNEIFSDVTIDKFMGFKYIIDKIDMYNAALSIVNYIESPPSDSGLLRVINEGASTTSEREVVEPDIPKRDISKQRKSYFDKLDEM